MKSRMHEQRSVGRLRREKFPTLYFIQPIESLAVGLANVDGHGHIGVKPGT